MNFTCKECNDTGSRDKLGTYLDCNACGTASTRRDLNDFVKSLGPTHPEDVALAIHQRALAMAPKQEAPVAAFDAATFIENKAAAYLDENASIDPDDGSTIFHYGSAGSEYYNGLVELAEEIRIAAPAAANGALTDEQIKEICESTGWIPEWNDRDHIKFARAILAAAGPDAAMVKALQKVRDYHVNHHIITEIDAALSGAKGN